MRRRLKSKTVTQLIVKNRCFACVLVMPMIKFLVFLTSGRQNPRDIIDVMKFGWTKTLELFHDHGSEFVSLQCVFDMGVSVSLCF